MCGLAALHRNCTAARSARPGLTVEEVRGEQERCMGVELALPNDCSATTTGGRSVDRMRPPQLRIFAARSHRSHVKVDQSREGTWSRVRTRGSRSRSGAPYQGQRGGSAGSDGESGRGGTGQA